LRVATGTLTFHFVMFIIGVAVVVLLIAIATFVLRGIGT
jgi:hypothetical protein